MSKYDFELEFEVRDYECALQGIVNNAVYLNYLEHSRHKYLKYIGFDFAELNRRGYDLVMTRCELDYRQSLRSGDLFVVGLHMVRRSKLRFAFHQEVLVGNDQSIALQARIVVTCRNRNGRPEFPDELLEKLVAHVKTGLD